MAAKKSKMKTVTLDAPIPVAPTRTVVRIGTPGFFRKVESNIKGGVGVPLAACTAIVSDKNRAGKTAVLDSFRLALTGAHPIGPHAVDLTGLTADGSLPWATLTGESASMDLRFPSGKKSPVHTGGGEFATMAAVDNATSMLPLVAMRDLLTLGTAKAREALFARFGGDGDMTDPPADLEEAQKALWRQALAAGRGDAVEQLTAAGTWLRSHKRELSARLRSLEDERERLTAVQAGTGVPTDDTIRALEAKLAAHQKYAQAAALREAAEASKSRLSEALTNYEANPPPIPLEQFQQEIQATQHRWDAAGAQQAMLEARSRLEVAQKSARLYALVHQLRKRLEADGCIVCGGRVHGDVGPLVAAAEKVATHELEQVKALEQSLAEAEEVHRVCLEEQKAELDRKMQQRMAQEQRNRAALSVLGAAKVEYERLLALLNDAGGAEVPDEPEAALREQLAALQVARASTDRLAELAAAVRATKRDQQDAKAVEGTLGDVLNGLVGHVKTTAEEAVNKWMPEGFKAALALEDNDGKPACRWEIVGSDGRPHPRGAASGAEWSALTVAIACAWSEGQKHRFLLLDDSDIAGFSAANVKNLLSMVAEAVRDGRLTQALVAWSRPKEIPDEGWSVVAL